MSEPLPSGQPTGFFRRSSIADQRCPRCGIEAGPNPDAPGDPYWRRCQPCAHTFCTADLFEQENPAPPAAPVEVATGDVVIPESPFNEPMRFRLLEPGDVIDASDLFKGGSAIADSMAPVPTEWLGRKITAAMDCQIYRRVALGECVSCRAAGHPTCICGEPGWDAADEQDLNDLAAGLEPTDAELAGEPEIEASNEVEKSDIARKMVSPVARRHITDALLDAFNAGKRSAGLAPGLAADDGGEYMSRIVEDLCQRWGLGELAQGEQLDALRQTLDSVRNDHAHLEEQIRMLAQVLLDKFGGPDRDEGACEMAGRLLKMWAGVLTALEPFRLKSLSWKDAEKAIRGSRPPGCRFLPLMLLQAEFAWMARERKQHRDADGAMMIATAAVRVGEVIDELRHE